MRLLLFATLMLACFSLACIRLQAEAGYTVKKPSEEAVTTRSVGIDTQKLVAGEPVPQFEYADE